MYFWTAVQFAYVYLVKKKKNDVQKNSWAKNFFISERWYEY